MLAIITGKISLFFTRLHTVKHFFSRKPTLDSITGKSLYFRSYYDICRQAFSLIAASIFSLMLLSQFLCSCTDADKEGLGKVPYGSALNSNEIDNATDGGIVCRISNGLQHTKVELGDWESVSSCPVFWNRGDRIAILCDDGAHSSYITENDKALEARFRYDEDLPGNNRLSVSEKYVALYPEEEWSADGSLLIPSIQTNAPNSCKGIFFPMVAVSSGTRTFDFSGVCGIIRLKCLASAGATTSTTTSTSACTTKNTNTESVTIKEAALYASQDIGNVRIRYPGNIGEEASAKSISDVFTYNGGTIDTDDADIMVSGNAEATNVILLELPGETTLTDDGTDFMFTVKPGEYAGIKFQLTLSDGNFLIYPVPDGFFVSKNVMNSFEIPAEAFFLSDKSIPELVIADESLISLDYTFSLSEVETDLASESDATPEAEDSTEIEDTSETGGTPKSHNTLGTGYTVGSGKFTVLSYRCYTFSDGTQWLSDVDMEASFSTDGGNTFSATASSALTEFAINHSSVSYTLAEEADSCIVRLTQRVSGKKINVTLK